MVDNIKTLFRFFKLYAVMDLLWFLRDTRYCLLYMVSDLVCLLCSMSGIFLLAARFGGLGGMTRWEILFMLGYASIVEGIYALFFTGNNAGMISRTIGRGQLDHAVIQPAPLWIQLLTLGFSPVSGSSALLLGTGITWYAIRHLELVLPPWWVLFLAVNAAASCLIMLSVIYLISCLAFYAPAAAEEIAQSGRDLFAAKTYPLGGFTPRMQMMFCMFIPVGMGAWFPSKTLLLLGYHGITGYFSLFRLLAVPAFATILITITTIVFQKGMNHYATYGSPRYSGFGHR